MSTNSNESNLPTSDTMITLDLIRKLYDDNAEPADLAQGLSEEHLGELERLVDAKRALDALPRTGPSADSIQAVIAAAKMTPAKKRGGLTLLMKPHLVQRFAAAAAIVAAVGIGYLTLSPGGISIQSADVDMAGEAVGNRPASKEMVDELFEADRDAPAPTIRREITPGVADEPEVLAKRLNETKEPTAKSEFAAAMNPTEESVVERPDGSIKDSVGLSSAARSNMQPPGRLSVASAVTPADTLGASHWNDEQAFQTFYWQVQALGERSPDNDWEESVPLEGSFRILDGAKRDPGWLETTSEK